MNFLFHTIKNTTSHGLMIVISIFTYYPTPAIYSSLKYKMSLLWLFYCPFMSLGFVMVYQKLALS